MRPLRIGSASETRAPVLEAVNIYYEGWGERWLWGTLVRTRRVTSRPVTVFEYSSEALSRNIELSSHRLPLKQKTTKGFPVHQLELPGPAYDALPDGWGMLLMERLFRKRQLSPASIGPLERLAYVGNNALGAMTFEPVAPEGMESDQHVSLESLASGVQKVMRGEGGEYLEMLMQVGGSPQGARPKALVYRDPLTLEFTTAHIAGYEPWLVKFPAKSEHPEVCAIESVYAHCLRLCDVQTPDSLHFHLPGGHAAFASKRFDRLHDMRIPVQSLASFTGADYQVPGSLNYQNFLRATHLCTRDIRQKAVAFERALFNVVFNNRDDHTKNFSYRMDQAGNWQLSPAYDVTYCTGPGGWHQMDVCGEALNIGREQMMQLAAEADLTEQAASELIEKMGAVASRFTSIAAELHKGAIRKETLQEIQRQIDANLARLR